MGSSNKMYLGKPDSNLVSSSRDTNDQSHAVPLSIILQVAISYFVSQSSTGATESQDLSTQTIRLYSYS